MHIFILYVKLNIMNRNSQLFPSNTYFKISKVSVIIAVDFSLVRCKSFHFLVYKWQGSSQLLNFVGLGINEVWVQSYTHAKLPKPRTKGFCSRRGRKMQRRLSWFYLVVKRRPQEVWVDHQYRHRGRSLLSEHRALCLAMVSRTSYKDHWTIL